MSTQDAANAPQYLTLEEWAALAISKPPSLYTLRGMARSGRIDPPAVKIGKAYYVERDAKVIDPHRRPSLVQRLKQA